MGRPLLYIANMTSINSLSIGQVCSTLQTISKLVEEQLSLCRGVYTKKLEFADARVNYLPFPKTNYLYLAMLEFDLKFFF